ncbi:MAG: HU family DNA-binding protein [Fretibacterium sp.]|nr:HU family DNA-binding protein [Fretibacterium sp.]
MTKAELIDGIAEKLVLKKKDVAPVVEEVFASIEGALARGEKCTFVGFGVFEVKDRAAREGRNPQDPTKVVKIPAKKVPVFRPGKDLKEKVLALSATKKKSAK